MLNFYPDAPSFGFKDAVEPALQSHFQAARQHLPELPDTINIWLTDSFVIPETGSGGLAYAPDIISIGYNPDFADKKLQQDGLKGMVFHESFHLAQGHTVNDRKAQYNCLLDSAIYEGCATVFERQYAASEPLWGDYSQHSNEQLIEWRDGMAAIPYDGEHKDAIVDTYDAWAFFDESDSQRWKLYKTGTWLVDQMLAKTGKDILELRQLNARQILDIAK